MKHYLHVNFTDILQAAFFKSAMWKETTVKTYFLNVGNIDFKAYFWDNSEA